MRPILALLFLFHYTLGSVVCPICYTKPCDPSQPHENLLLYCPASTLPGNLTCSPCPTNCTQCSLGSPYTCKCANSSLPPPSPAPPFTCLLCNGTGSTEVCHHNHDQLLLLCNHTVNGTNQSYCHICPPYCAFCYPGVAPHLEDVCVCPGAPLQSWQSIVVWVIVVILFILIVMVFVALGIRYKPRRELRRM